MHSTASGIRRFPSSFTRLVRRAKIFISYRRDDSFEAAKLLHNELAAYFGKSRVFMDIEDIHYGDDFKSVIDDKIRRCNVVIAVIGPQWSEILARRAAADDYVRYEIASALEQRARRGTRVIPVLVGGATPSDMDAVPGLKTISATVLDRREWNQNITALKEAIQEWKFDEFRQRIVSSRWAKGAALVVSFVVFSAAWVALLDVPPLYLDTRLSSLTIGLGELAGQPRWSGKVVVVTIDRETERSVGATFDRSWRPRHAEIVGRLARAGVRTIAFDITFEDPTPGDKGLARAFAEARNRHTAVVVAVAGTGEGGAPVLAEPLLKVLEEKVDGREGHAWGIACAGTTILGYANSMPLAVERGQRPLPSLALAAYSGGGRVTGFPGDSWAEFWRVPEVSVRMMSGDKDEGVSSFRLERVCVPDKDKERCPAITTGDRAALQLLAATPLGFWRQPPHRMAYERVLRARDEELTDLRGKIVLIGVTTPSRDEWPVAGWPRTTKRFGVELIADQLDAIQRKEVLRPLGNGWQFITMLVVALGGAYARWWGDAWSALVRRGALLGLVLAYLAGVIWIYRSLGLLLNVPYEIGAFAVAYWAMRWLKRPGIP